MVDGSMYLKLVIRTGGMYVCMCLLRARVCLLACVCLYMYVVRVREGSWKRNGTG